MSGTLAVMELEGGLVEFNGCAAVSGCSYHYVGTSRKKSLENFDADRTLPNTSQ